MLLAGEQAADVRPVENDDRKRRADRERDDRPRRAEEERPEWHEPAAAIDATDA